MAKKSEIEIGVSAVAPAAEIEERNYHALLESFSELAASLNDLHQLAVQQYAPVVNGIIRSRSQDVRRIEQVLDGLLDHCCYDSALLLFKQLGRHYFTIDPLATVDYINIYREVWDSEAEEEIE